MLEIKEDVYRMFGVYLEGMSVKFGFFKRF